MRSIAIGLSTIYHNNIVYTDLKIENILIKGFNNKSLGSGKLLVIKIANLGIVKLINKDIPEKDIETVYAALNPVSELRPSALELLKYGYI
ncbi:uncharacterized protein TERG_06752 [Trichophyton rubrum CBS 118892]|uniref:Protein kinase domain-containing protein n=1 Tax=Trichophyton rubrum (strain ATCC MYA-4607 / CBS 118892) TaxID=559305 RepID=F2SW30_TRIRC|nr:uncharacterized protein TERG_06752 [Trichophyton rubrum CBS 118892]EGD90524.2 hypothetical protein TERG_06752 [Trichophyton rubrum CBS 118892]